MQLNPNELERLAWLIRQNDWLSIAGFARLMQRKMSSGLMKKYAGAVNRILDYFRRYSDGSDWPPNLSVNRIQEYIIQIAWFVREFGNAKPLIDDIKKSFSDGHRPRSIVYYLVSEKGYRASRWELLLDDHRQREWQKVKDEEKRAADKIDLGDLKLPGINVADDFWIRAAMADYHNALGTKNHVEASRIAAKLKSLGVEISTVP